MGGSGLEYAAMMIRLSQKGSISHVVSDLRPISECLIISTDFVQRFIYEQEEEKKRLNPYIHCGTAQKRILTLPQS